METNSLIDTPTDINTTKNGSEENEEDPFYETPLISQTARRIDANDNNTSTKNSRLNLRQASKSHLNDPQSTSSRYLLEKPEGLQSMSIYYYIMCKMI